METITNQAHVTFSYGDSETTKTNYSNIVNSSIKDKYSISVEKTSTTECFRAGEIISYTISVKNTGCGCLSNFEITDTLAVFIVKLNFITVIYYVCGKVA